MKTAKIFNNGQSQEVHLPEDCNFDDTEVYVKKYGNMVILIPVNDPWGSFTKSLDEFSDDFMEDRNQ
ncbi:MAG: AbrB/MazE/SpoVT family DNA-binding domain-containing protein [bacterium]|nr:AbrB/MazE/SpoVT family DNA-binding domain-containing protein [bacterium]